MAGPAMDKNGGGTDYLCLVLDPSPTAVRASELNGAWLQGTEIFSGSSTNGENLRCAVCAPKYRSAVITIPGKNVCPAGWVKEYAGRSLIHQCTIDGRSFDDFVFYTRAFAGGFSVLICIHMLHVYIYFIYISMCQNEFNTLFLRFF